MEEESTEFKDDDPIGVWDTSGGINDIIYCIVLFALAFVSFALLIIGIIGFIFGL